MGCRRGNQVDLVSVSGQQLWVLALSVCPERHSVGIPEFKYVANMHGNEVTTHTHTHALLYRGSSQVTEVARHFFKKQANEN